MAPPGTITLLSWKIPRVRGPVGPWDTDLPPRLGLVEQTCALLAHEPPADVFGFLGSRTVTLVAVYRERVMFIVRGALPSP